MELIDKANILVELRDTMPMHEVIVTYDIAIPYAVGLVNGEVLALSSEGEQRIDNAWNVLCTMYDADPDAFYSNLDDIIPRGELYWEPTYENA